MAITAAEAIVRQYRSPSDGLSYRVFAAELIGWENSDAQDHPVCCCHRLDRDWFRSMGASTTNARVFPSIGQGIEPFKLMVNAKNLSQAELVDYTFVFR